VQVAQEYLGEVDERITRMATVLPGGLSLRGGTCGILLGALGSMGLKYGSLKRDERDLSKALSLRVHDFFQELTRERFGTTNCRDISGCDFTNAEESRAFVDSAAQHRCAGLLTETVRFLLPLLDTPHAAKEDPDK
jgi:C_GCAxxG_C_C family probable redox protein